MSFPILTNRLRIQPLGIADVGNFVRYRRNPLIARFQGWETTYSEDDALRLIETQVGVTIPAQGDWVQLGIHLRDTEELLGDLGLHSATDDEPIFEIGFTTPPSSKGRGTQRKPLLHSSIICSPRSVRRKSLQRRTDETVRRFRCLSRSVFREILRAAGQKTSKVKRLKWNTSKCGEATPWSGIRPSTAPTPRHPDRPQRQLREPQRERLNDACRVTRRARPNRCRGRCRCREWR